MSSQSEARLGALDRVLDANPGAESMSDDLFAVVDALDSSAALRRALTDPSTPEDGRRALAHGLLDGRVGSAAVDLVAEAAAMRWAGGRTLTAALERQGVRAQLIASERAGELEETEDSLFRFARLVESSPALRDALGDRSAPLAARRALVADLLDGKATAATSVLAQRAVGARLRTFGHTIESYVTLAAAHKSRVVATVRVAQPLSAEQQGRLQVALSRQVGRQVAVQVVLDPSVLGGVRVELGDEIIEGTIGAKLAEAQRLFG